METDGKRYNEGSEGDLNWGQILMDSLTVAIIGAVAVLGSTLLANWITDVKGYKKLNLKIGEVPNTTLSGQHKDIEAAIKEGNCSLNEQVKDSIKGSTESILSSSNTILTKVEKINDHLIKEKADHENSFKNLDKDQQKIKGHVEGIHALVKDWERTISRNRELENKVIVLEEKVQKLTLELSRVNQDRSNDRDEQDLER